MSSERGWRDRCWTIVLAGGEGRRLQGLVTSWLGDQRPKQFCRFFGDKTLLEHTWARAERLTDRSRILTVLGPGHRHYLVTDGIEPPGTVLEQPANLDTAPGVFLALSHVLALDPEATVLLLPSDHWVDPESAFVGRAEMALRLADELADRLVLLGALPDGPETEYGWVEPGAVLAPSSLADGHGARLVLSFHEKPDRDFAERYYRERFLWNTMVIAARARALWSLGRLAMPELSVRFDTLSSMLAAIREQRAPRSLGEALLSHTYDKLTPANFSHGLLERVASRTVVLPLEGVRWSDWGSPRRLLQGLNELGQPCPGRGDTLAAARPATTAA